MKAATSGDKPVGFSAPGGIVTATVCRLSGKLATEGCNHAVVLSENGEVAGRSMVYTEYFARGTEPTSFCNLHPMGGFTGAVATVFTPSDKPDPVHIEPARPPAAVVTETAHGTFRCSGAAAWWRPLSSLWSRRRLLFFARST